MFNSYSNNSYNTQSIKINAVTGSILKNHPKSWFECFDLNSTRANALLHEGGHKGGAEHYHHSYGSLYPPHDSSVPVHDPAKDIVILQMIVCGDMKVIAECVYQKDYDVSIVIEAGKDG